MRESSGSKSGVDPVTDPLSGRWRENPCLSLGQPNAPVMTESFLHQAGA